MAWYGLYIREDTHKEVVFLVVGPLRFYPPFTNGFMVHATKQFSPFIEKNVVFCLVVGGVTPPYTLSGTTTKKNTLFYVCLPLVGKLILSYTFLIITTLGTPTLKSLYYLEKSSLLLFLTWIKEAP